MDSQSYMRKFTNCGEFTRFQDKINWRDSKVYEQNRAGTYHDRNGLALNSNFFKIHRHSPKFTGNSRFLRMLDTLIPSILSSNCKSGVKLCTIVRLLVNSVTISLFNHNLLYKVYVSHVLFAFWRWRFSRIWLCFLLNRFRFGGFFFFCGFSFWFFSLLIRLGRFLLIFTQRNITLMYVTNILLHSNINNNYNIILYITFLFQHLQ